MRVEIPQRCWIEADLGLDEYKNIQSVTWHAQGSFDLIQECEKFFTSALNKNLEALSITGTKTSQLLLGQIVDRFKGQFKEYDASLEICHCRKITQGEIVQAILLGAHTHEKIKKWTTASSGCGTCKADVENILAVCLKK